MRTRHANSNRNPGRLAAACLAIGIATAGCSDATGPGANDRLDTGEADASLSVFGGFFGSPEWRSFEAFGGGVEGSGATAALVPADAATRLLAAASRVPVISEGSLGTTWAIDPQTGEYVQDADRDGAPSNGVRFILYAPLDGSETPDLSTEIGHVDLLDLGADSAGIDLRLTAVAEDVTFLDYRVAVEGDEAAGSVAVDGFLVHEGDRLDFSFSADATDDGSAPTLSVDATLDVDSRDFHVALQVDGEGPDGAATVDFDLAVRFEAQSIDVSAVGRPGTISAEFRVNGDLFATAEGSEDEPTIVGADGEPLTLDEIRVLGEIIHVSEDVLEFFGELLEPAGDIIELGLIL